MSALELVIGNKRFSSWSLRPWLVAKASGLPFKETLVRFGDPAWPTLTRSPSGRVPVLHHGDVTVHESLAIAEYLAELAPHAHLWPSSPGARAVARAAACEMHAGFAALRAECTMDTYVHQAPRERSAAVKKDVARLETLWSECHAHFGSSGPFLFGAFGIVDAMFAPVALRFRSYGLQVGGFGQVYVERLLAWPALGEWVEAAKAEADWGEHP
jgi:glutathione S-transferase